MVLILILTKFELRDKFRVLSQETRYFESETPILPIKPVEISPNFKSDARENLTSRHETKSKSRTSLKPSDSF